MEKILATYIKELINRYPQIKDVLDDYNIGCVTCSVGTCKLSDIIEIHNLSEHDEYALFSKIAAIVFTDQAVSIPRLQRKTAGITKKAFSPPVKMLIDEHVVIKKVLAVLPDLVSDVKNNHPEAQQILEKAFHFIRYYADRFHHAKEENILFKDFDTTSEIILSMTQEHEIGRTYIRQAVESLEMGNYQTLEMHVHDFVKHLSEHIKKEDEILFPWIDRSLSDSRIGTLYASFLQVANDFDVNVNDLVNFAETVG